MSVIDEHGKQWFTIHGVRTNEWLGIIGDVIGSMRNPKKIWQLGLAKLPDDEKNQHTCHDPDCARLNRTDEAIAAKYIIEKDALAVKYVPESDPERDAKERKIAEGHPTKAGSYLCELCARVAFAKRIIDAKRERGLAPAFRVGRKVMGVPKTMNNRKLQRTLQEIVEARRAGNAARTMPSFHPKQDPAISVKDSGGRDPLLEALQQRR